MCFNPKNKKVAFKYTERTEVFVPCALLHDRADELTNEGQELVCVSGVELFQKGEQAEHQRRPVNGVCSFPAGHS